MHGTRRLLVAFLFPIVIACAPRQSANDGTGDAAQLTQTGTGFYQEVSWAPDGSGLTVSVLETADTPEGFQYRVHFLTFDPPRLVALTVGPMDLWTSWAPDGHHIAYAARSAENVGSDIYVVGADGSERIRLTDHPADDSQPDWSPGGTHIAFVSNRGGTDRVYVMKANGSEQTPIGTPERDAQNPVWSRDGEQIAYYETGSSGDDEIYLMNADGTGRRLLVKGVWPSWFPDGNKILFGAPEGLSVVNLDGGGRSLLVPGAEFGALSPDGNRIAYIKTSDGRVSVFAMKTDGSGTVHVLTRPAPEW